MPKLRFKIFYFPIINPSINIISFFLGQYFSLNSVRHCVPFKKFLIMALLIPWTFSCLSQESRNYLTHLTQGAVINRTVSDIDKWKVDQYKLIKNSLLQLPDFDKKVFITDAEIALKYTWPLLSANLYMGYVNKGNRSEFENMMYERRYKLDNLVIGFLLTNNKKYLPQIVNGIWSILEESSWVWPAHLFLQKSGNGLPDPFDNVIDLGAGETASEMAMISFILNEELNVFSPIINKRIKFELDKRIFHPYLLRNDFWWMGYGQKIPNNWNPWINTNILYAALYTESNKDTLVTLLNKIFNSTDKFINIYPDDGSCDEGYEYWGEAGGKLIRMLYLVNEVSGNKVDFSDLQLLHNMGAYILKVYIGNGYFVNFADADKILPRAESIYHYGQMFNDTSLKYFAAYIFKLSGGKLNNNSIVDFIEAAKVFKAINTVLPDPVLPSFSWLPNLQVLTARNKTGNISKGLFFAAQGGHNAESHNHNDVGNFILYNNGEPVIIDAGVGEYTSKTFGPDRYDTWNLQSQWHNCPSINGLQQKDGRQYEATDVSFDNNKKTIKLSMNISKAYSLDAAVEKWVRFFTFKPDKNELQLNEQYQLKEWKGYSKINFLTCASVNEIKPGVLLFVNKQGKRLLQMVFNPLKLDFSIEKKLITDPVIKANWGEELFRLVFSIKSKKLNGENLFRFTIPE